MEVTRGRSLPSVDVWDLSVPVGASAKGYGGGEVFKATTRSTGETVAVKFTSLQSGRAEAKLLHAAGASTAHLPRLHGFQRAGDKAVLVMQWGGASVPERPHPAPLSVALVISVLRGVEALHALGKIHGDIHSYNVIANEELDPESVLLIDAGNARKLANGRWRGTDYWSEPQFMAPELQGERSPKKLLDVDCTVDLFAATSLLVRYITGKDPFVRRPMDGFGFGLGEAMRRGPRLPRDLDPDLAKVIRKALAYDPQDRYRSCKELIKALKPFAAKRAAAKGDANALKRVIDIYYPRERKALDVALGVAGDDVSVYRKHAKSTSAAELVSELHERALAAVEALSADKDRERLAHYYGGLSVRMNMIGPPLSWHVNVASPDIGAHVDAARDFSLEQIRGTITYRFEKLAKAVGSRARG